MHLNSRLYKLVCSACLLLSTSALIMIAGAPASGYEISIYTTNLSPFVWVLLIASMGGSIFLLVNQALSNDNQENNRWLIPLFILMFSSLIVLLLPILKGYLMYNREDGLGQLGFIKDTASNGRFSAYNFYPVFHIITVALAIVTGLSADELILYMLPIFSLSYMLSFYFLARSIFHSQGQVILASTLGVIPLLPHAGSLSASIPPALIFPLVLALLIQVLRTRSFNYTLLLILMLVLVPFWHPLATVVIMITLVLTYLVQVVVNRRLSVKQAIPFNFLFILVIASFVWFANFFIFNEAVEWAIRLFAWDTEISPIPRITTELEKVQLHGLSIITLGFKIYGGEVICGALAIIGVLLVIKGFKFSKYEIRENTLISALFIGFSIIYLAYYAGFSFGLGEIYSRFILYIPVPSVLLASLALGETTQRYGRIKLITVLAVCLILASAALSIFNKYSSPYRYLPNSQVTHMEISGTKWVITNIEWSAKVTYIGTAIRRYSTGIYGHDFVRRNSIDPGFPYRRPISIPDHFNYQDSLTLGESFSESGYMMLSEFDRLLYQYAWQSVGRFNQQDFNQLEQDPTADRLYANGEFDVWFVRSVTPAITERSG